MSSKPTITVLGTGTIGAPVARNLQRHGFPVRVWNRTASKAQALTSAGIQAFDTPGEAVQGSQIILTVLKDAASIREVIQAAAPHLVPGTIWLQLSTVGVEGITELAELAQQYGLVLYDAPLQGTRQPAEAGQLVILPSGPLEFRETIQPVFDAIGKRTVWVSEEVGASSRLKLVLNNWVFALTHGVAESLALARGLQVDPALFVSVVTGGPMDNPYFQMKAAAILNDDYEASFTVENAIKDTRLVLAAAEQAGIPLELAEAGLQRFEGAQQAGHGDKDMAASYLASPK